jgi:hypothetical protein
MIDARQFDIGKYSATAFETITVANTAVGLTNSNFNTSPRQKRCFITCESAQIRYRLDGVAPTSTTGHILNPMSSLLLEGYNQMLNFQAIRVGSTSGTIMVSYLI